MEGGSELVQNLYLITIIIKHCKNQLTMLITQYYGKMYSNCMLEHNGRPYFRPLDRRHTDCDLRWRCVDVHEDIMQIGCEILDQCF